MFGAFVVSVLNYACEIWGNSKSKEIKRIHLNFCKRLLKVQPNTCNACVYGELGIYPMYANRYLRIMKYWLKIVNTDNIILKTVYAQALHDCNNCYTNWVSKIKKLLNDYGFSYIFDYVDYINHYICLCAFRNRVLDTFKQDWSSTVNNSPVLVIYKEIKNILEYEKYLDILPKSFRLYFTRLRLSAHPLRIQTGRYAGNRTIREDRYCLLSSCNNNH